MTLKHYKEIFFHGYIIAFLSILCIATLFDVYIKNYTDAKLELLTLVLVGSLYYLWKLQIKRLLISIILAWISALFGIVIVLQYDFTQDTPFFLLFVPFSFLYLLDKSVLVVHLSLYYLVAISMIIWGYFYSSNRLFFDSTIHIAVWGSLFLFVLAIGIFNHIMLSRSFLHLEKSNTQKDILLQEVHHRVKNNLNMMSSMIGLQETYNDPKMESFVNDYRKRINAIGLIHDILYKNENYEKIDFKTYVDKLSFYLITSCAHQESIVTVKAKPLTLSLQMMTSLGLILQELISNSLKYADSGVNKINIDFVSQGEEYLLTYADNGSSQDTQITSTDSLGLNLIDIKVQELKGTFHIEKKSKALYTLTLKNKQEYTQDYHTYIYTIRFPHES